MNPIGIFLMVVFGFFVLASSRSNATVALIAGVSYLTQGQAFDLAGFNMTAIRLLLLSALLRILIRGESFVRLNSIDKAVLAYGFAIAFISILRVGNMEAVIYQVGFLYNIFLSYFIFRCLLKGENDFCNVLSKAALVIIPLAMSMAYESSSGRNVFSIFGDVPENSMIRDGSVRSQGVFRSPITAGAFGATFSLLFASMFFAHIRRRIAVVGFVASMIILLSAHSSGPLLGAFLGVTGFICWRVRHHIQKIRWGILLALVGLHLVMKAPVWFLLGRISDLVGGGGYHRAYLIDIFVKHFSSWWLIGTNDTGDWMATKLASGGADLTNQFVSDGVAGGVIGLGISVMLIARCFQHLGSTLRKSINNSSKEKLLWGIGATLAGSVAILFSVTYFDQMHVIWYFLLASIASMPTEKRQVVSPREGVSNQRFVNCKT